MPKVLQALSLALCANVLAAGSDLAEFSPELVEIACSNPDKFILNTDEDIWAAFDRLAASKDGMNKGAFEALTKACGLNYKPHCILASHALRAHIGPASTFTYDWMHVFCRTELRIWRCIF